ncbi:MAG TPA: lipid-binding SYLF domain-containing protein [Thiobacillaceae bacterium]|nr:lipid-binding SYLF domain-containing protein [Thiobacillaceae bacterium]
MRTLKKLLIASLLLGVLPIAGSVFAAAEEADKLSSASDVLEKITTIPEQSIPPALLKDAHGLAVIPGVIKAGFVVGGSYGKGVLTVRDKDGRWSAPVFVTLKAGSVGWQIGAESTDVLLVFKTAKSVDGIVKGTFTLGADAAVAAGPVGRRGEAATDTELKAEILSYSRSRGLFAGVSLEGSSIGIDYASNKDFYGKEASPAEILGGKVSMPPSGQKFLDVVSKVTAGN